MNAPAETRPPETHGRLPSRRRKPDTATAKPVKMGL